MLWIGIGYEQSLPAGPATARTTSRAAAYATGRTAVAGVWAAGNVTDLSAQVGAAAAAGALAAAHINADLVAEDTRVAVDSLRRTRREADA